MATSFELSLDPVSAASALSLPELVPGAGPAGVFAAEQFFSGRFRNRNTHAGEFLAHPSGNADRCMTLPCGWRPEIVPPNIAASVSI
jgi:hypothetical protein